MRVTAIHRDNVSHADVPSSESSRFVAEKRQRSTRERCTMLKGRDTWKVKAFSERRGHRRINFQEKVLAHTSKTHAFKNVPMLTAGRRFRLMVKGFQLRFNGTGCARLHPDRIDLRLDILLARLSWSDWSRDIETGVSHTPVGICRALVFSSSPLWIRNSLYFRGR